MSDPTHHLRVFLSSTSEDLHAFRDSAAVAIQRLNMVPVRMEAFGASGSAPLEVSRREIADADALVVLVGHRYGWVPPAEAGGDGTKSITWLEMEAAEEARKPVFCFIVDEEAPWTGAKEQDALLEATSPEETAQIARRVQSLRQFRQYVMSRVIVGTFRTPDELAAKVIAALANYYESRRRSAEPTSKIQHVKQAPGPRVVRLFLSSPGDVRDERDAAERVVHRFNQTWFEDRRIFVKVVRWESMAPQIGPGPQPVVAKQLNQRPIDLFVGIMWNRFGTPTPTSGSGTEQEFQEALSTWREKGRPWITFYFCQRPSNLSTKEGLAQKTRVLEFRETVNANGILRDFEGIHEFEEMLYQDLVSITGLPEFQAS